MPKCSVKKCRNNTLTTLKKDGVSYFRYPTNEIERAKWQKIVAAERGEDSFKPNKSSVVCSSHFSENDSYTTPNGLRRIKKGVLPSIGIEISPRTEQNVLPGSTRNEPSTSRDGDSSEVNILTRQPLITTTTVTNMLTSGNVTYTDGDPLALQIKSEENNLTVVVFENEEDTELESMHPCPSAPISENTPIMDTPETSYYKRKLGTCQKSIELKNKQIQNLKKKNKRLMKRNLILKTYKESFRVCQKSLNSKNKLIQNLHVKNKRLMKQNLILKEMIADLQNKQLK